MSDIVYSQAVLSQAERIKENGYTSQDNFKDFGLTGQDTQKK